MPERWRLGTREKITRSGLTVPWVMQHRESSAPPVINSRSTNPVILLDVVVLRFISKDYHFKWSNSGGKPIDANGVRRCTNEGHRILGFCCRGPIHACLA